MPAADPDDMRPAPGDVGEHDEGGAEREGRDHDRDPLRQPPWNAIEQRDEDRRRRER